MRRLNFYIIVVNIFVLAGFLFYASERPTSYLTRTNFILPYVRATDAKLNRQLWHPRDLISKMVVEDSEREGYKWNFWLSADEKNIFFDIYTNDVLLARPLVDKFVQQYLSRFCSETKLMTKAEIPVCQKGQKISLLEQSSFKIGDEEFFPPRYQILIEDRSNFSLVSIVLFLVYSAGINVFLIFLYRREVARANPSVSSASKQN